MSWVVENTFNKLGLASKNGKELIVGEVECVWIWKHTDKEMKKKDFGREAGKKVPQKLLWQIVIIMETNR